jgi:hypothetical protein
VFFLAVTYDTFWLVVNYESPFLIIAVKEFGASGGGEGDFYT